MSELATDTRARIIAEVCARVTAGETISGIFREKPEGWPDRATFWRWVRAVPAFRDEVYDAMEFRADVWSEEMLRIALDDKTMDADAKRIAIDVLK